MQCSHFLTLVKGPFSQCSDLPCDVKWRGGCGPCCNAWPLKMTALSLLFSVAHKSGWGVWVLGCPQQGLNTDHIKNLKKKSGYKWSTCLVYLDQKIENYKEENDLASGELSILTEKLYLNNIFYKRIYPYS